MFYFYFIYMLHYFIYWYILNHSLYSALHHEYVVMFAV